MQRRNSFNAEFSNFFSDWYNLIRLVFPYFSLSILSFLFDLHFSFCFFNLYSLIFFIRITENWFKSHANQRPPWRNRLARSAVNRKVGGSSPPGGGNFFHIFSKPSWTKRLTLAGLEPAIPWFVVRCLIRWATGPFYFSNVRLRILRPCNHRNNLCSLNDSQIITGSLV